MLFQQEALEVVSYLTQEQLPTCIYISKDLLKLNSALLEIWEIERLGLGLGEKVRRF